MVAENLKIKDLVERLEILNNKDLNASINSYNDRREISESASNFEYISDGEDGSFEQPLQLNSNYFQFFMAIIDLWFSGKLNNEQTNSYLKKIDYFKLSKTQLVFCINILVNNFEISKKMIH